LTHFFTVFEILWMPICNYMVLFHFDPPIRKRSTQTK